MPSSVGDALDQISVNPVAGFETKPMEPAVDLTKEAIQRALGSNFVQQLPQHISDALTKMATPTETRMRELLAKFGGNAPK